MDDAQNAFQAAEADLTDVMERMLAAVAANYGKDSTQYEMAGGTRKSERRRRISAAATATAAAK